MCVHHGGHAPIYPQVISILAVGGEPPEFSYILSNRFSNVLSALVKVETFCYYQGLWFKMFFQGAGQCSESLGTWKVWCQQVSLQGVGLTTYHAQKYGDFFLIHNVVSVEEELHPFEVRRKEFILRLKLLQISIHWSGHPRRQCTID